MAVKEKIKVVIDVFGSDDPAVLIADAAEATRLVDATLVLPGDPAYIEENLAKHGADISKIEILPAPDVITNDDSPALAVLRKKQSSLAVGMRYLKENEDAVGLISAGNTGAILAGSTLIVGRLPGVVLPSLATLLPSLGDHYSCMLDCGANVDCTAVQLSQFALMGRALIQSLYGIKDPSCALLSVGTEDKKGNAVTKEAFSKLSALPINFAGNMEARDALTGKYDVIVTDGFAGNVLLKTLEGTVSFMITMMDRYVDAFAGEKINEESMKTKSTEYSKDNFMTPTTRAMIPEGKSDADFAHRAVKGLAIDMNIGARGGAFLLGTNKTVMKVHGGSFPGSVVSGLRQVIEVTSGGFIEKQKEYLTEIMSAEL